MDGVVFVLVVGDLITMIYMIVCVVGVPVLVVVVMCVWLFVCV